MGASWKGSISFGLIYIPINLNVAATDSDISFNQLHNKCKHRINYKKICPICNEEVKHEDIIKGYNYSVTTPQNWKEVLAVYAVKYSTDPQNPAEVVTIDNEKFEDIKKSSGT